MRLVCLIRHNTTQHNTTRHNTTQHITIRITSTQNCVQQYTYKMLKYNSINMKPAGQSSATGFPLWHIWPAAHRPQSEGKDPWVSERNVSAIDSVLGDSET